MKKRLIASAIALALMAHGAIAADASVEQKHELRAELAKMKSQQAAPTTNAAAAVASAPSGTMSGIAAGSNTFGGYGELHYNNFKDGDKKDEIDFHRFVLFFGHKFTDNLRFHSELELEHAFAATGRTGEV